jgi:hypothetical protein
MKRFLFILTIFCALTVAHEWQHTTDVTNFTNRIAADSTLTAHTDVSGLTVGTKYAFFHKQIISTGNTDWEGPVFLIVT